MLLRKTQTMSRETVQRTHPYFPFLYMSSNKATIGRACMDKSDAEKQRDIQSNTWLKQMEALLRKKDKKEGTATTLMIPVYQT